MDAVAAAHALTQARVSRSALEALPPSLPDSAGLADGYAVQDAMIAAAAQPGAPLGALIGATNAGAQAAMGFGPFYGPLFACSQQADGSSVSLASLGAAFKAAEAEFAFVMSADLPPRATPYTEDEVWAAAGAVCPAIELAASRFSTLALPAAVLADGAWNGCFVVGAGVAPAAVPGGATSLAGAGAALLVNGALVAANKGANVLGNPLTALTWLANALSGAGHTLRAGQVVMTGAAAAHKEVAMEDAVSAVFTGLGAGPLSVAINVTP